MKEKANQSVFSVLNAINVNEYTETKSNGTVELTYLSWTWAWTEIKKLYPDADYKIFRDENGRPYIDDPDYGIMCYTSVTIEGKTYEMWLPVMDGANKAMKRNPYTYKVYDRRNNQWREKRVEAATMFDINKTIMRCLVKNLAMFGLGLYIYAGEDLPSDERERRSEAEQADYDLACQRIKEATTREELVAIWKDCPSYHVRQDFIDRINARQGELAA